MFGPAPGTKRPNTVATASCTHYLFPRDLGSRYRWTSLWSYPHRSDPVDRLTKMAHFMPTDSDVTAERTVDLYLGNVFKHHGLPDDIVLDRGTQFVSKFTRRLLELLDIKGNRSTASHHPESDGQTERKNQTLEQYIRTHCDYHQNDWSQLLPFAEFTYNNAVSSSTRKTPFYANLGYHPRATLKVRTNQDAYQNPLAESLVASSCERTWSEHKRPTSGSSISRRSQRRPSKSAISSG